MNIWIKLIPAFLAYAWSLWYLIFNPNRYSPSFLEFIAALIAVFGTILILSVYILWVLGGI